MRKRHYIAIFKNFFTKLLVDYFIFYYFYKIIFIKKNKYGNFINHKFRSSEYKLFIKKNDRNVPFMLLNKQMHKIDYIYNHSMKNNTQNFFDFGSNYGEFIFPLREVKNIVSIDAYKDLIECQKITFFDKKITFINKMISFKKGYSEFYLNEFSGTSSHKLSQNPKYPTTKKVNVDTVDVASIFDKLYYENTIIKIDIEGMESVALKAILNIENKFQKDTLIFFEYNINSISKFNEISLIIKELKKKNFTLRFIHPSKEKFKANGEVKLESLEENLVGDYVLLRN